MVQEKLIEAKEKYGNEDLIVVLGCPDSDSADIYAETVIAGDPTYSGPLAGVALKLYVYHILEDELKENIPEDIYQEFVGLMELSLDKEAICKTMQEAREKY